MASSTPISDYEVTKEISGNLFTTKIHDNIITIILVNKSHVYSQYIHDNTKIRSKKGETIDYSQFFGKLISFLSDTINTFINFEYKISTYMIKINMIIKNLITEEISDTFSIKFNRQYIRHQNILYDSNHNIYRQICEEHRTDYVNTKIDNLEKQVAELSAQLKSILDK